MTKFSNFSNLYPVSKTLRFELKPIGKTYTHIKNAGIIQEDELRASNYIKMKKIIDRYHKKFIDASLALLPQLNVRQEFEQLLKQFLQYYTQSSRTEEDNKAFQDTKDNLRKLIVYVLTGKGKNREKEDPVFCKSQNEKYTNLFKEELFSQTLVPFVNGEEEQKLLAEFQGFTTYFSGFNKNRKNMYSIEEQTTAIAYRLVHDNLPKFIDNIQVFEKIKNSLSEEISETYDLFAQTGRMHEKQLADVFSIEYFSRVLTQDGIDFYNAIIGKDQTELKGLNERINLYNQKQQKKEDKLPLFKPLYKQILSDREQLSSLPEKFETDQELLNALHKYIQRIEDDTLNRTKLLLQSIADYDLSQIHIKSDALSSISKDIFGDWAAIAIAREKEYDLSHESKKKNKNYEKARESFLKSNNLSINALNSSIKLVPDYQGQTIENYFAQLSLKNDLQEKEPKEDLIDSITNAYKLSKDLLSTPYTSKKKLAQDKNQVALIKNLLDAIRTLQRFLKPLMGAKDQADKDEIFYGEFNYIWSELEHAIPLYNKIRNHLTRKPYVTEKIKLNFGKSTLLDGWDKNKERNNLGVLLRKDNNFYLGIMNKNHNTCFEIQPLPDDGECYEKMHYKLLPDPFKMLPKVFLSDKGIAAYKPSETIQKNYIEETHKKGPKKKGSEFCKQDMHNLIDFFKQSIEKHEDWKQFDFKFSETSSYQDISEFYDEVDRQGYKLTFRRVSKRYIDELIDKGQLYLFQIYNKDFSPYSKGKPNLHTLYWKMLFDEDNLKEVVYKLNGKAEVFFRKLNDELRKDKPTHPANQPIKKKNPFNKGEESLFTYPLIKDKRYTEDKFLFHVPITVNVNEKTKNPTEFNKLAIEHIQEKKDMRIIGIDRGERNLLYVCIIDSKGKIIKQLSLNQISSTVAEKECTTDYHALLEERNTQRQKERQNWMTIEGIKDLKKGYLSQVIHTISNLIIEHQAIVVLEDLNMGFKRGRQKVESAVYQQFEKQLIDKLNFLVNKNLDPNEQGGLLKAYQLTTPFKSFRDIKKQNGFLFYVPAAYTSKIDPTTGFTNLFRSRDIRYESIDKSKAFFAKFDSIRYNPREDWFEFAFDYKIFWQKAPKSRTEWTICTYGERIKTFRNPKKNNQWDCEDIALTPMMKALLEKYNINYLAGEDLKKAITTEVNNKDFFVQLLDLLKLTLQMRNSRKETGDDYIISPVAQNGVFFDSRKATKDLPQDADANGAYNIALKGLWSLKKIRETGKLLTISNQEWLQFIQEKPYLTD